MIDDDLDNAIVTFFKLCWFGTPKQLIEAVYPDFQKRYPDRNSFRIIVHKRLRRLGLEKLPFSFYCLPEKRSWFYLILKLFPKLFFNWNKSATVINLSSGEQQELE